MDTKTIYIICLIIIFILSKIDQNKAKHYCISTGGEWQQEFWSNYCK